MDESKVLFASGSYSKSGLFVGKGNSELCSLTRFAFYGHFSIMSLNNFFTDGEADARPLVFICAVEPLEGFLNLFKAFFIEADAIVFN